MAPLTPIDINTRAGHVRYDRRRTGSNLSMTIQESETYQQLLQRVFLNVLAHKSCTLLALDIVEVHICVPWQTSVGSERNGASQSNQMRTVSLASLDLAELGFEKPQKHLFSCLCNAAPQSQSRRPYSVEVMHAQRILRD